MNLSKKEMRKIKHRLSNDGKPISDDLLSCNGKESNTPQGRFLKTKSMTCYCINLIDLT